MLHHTLITRFNLATPGREEPFRNRPGWLETRFNLFERFCLPSVAAQTCQDFDWILFLDEHTPDWARARIDTLSAKHPFRAIYTPIFDNFGWARAVRAIAGPPQAGRFLLTSNLDNDDALAFDYVARVRKAAAGYAARGRYAINIPEGCMLAGNRLFRHRHKQNAFTNLVEPDDDNFATTMTIRHMELSDHVPVIQAEGGPGWLQVIHGNNVSNLVRGIRVGSNHAAGYFPAEILGEISEPGPLTLLIEALFLSPLRMVRDMALTIARRFVRVDPDAGEA